MKWLSVDPGGTTGYCLWKDNEHLDGGQIELWEFADAVWAGLEYGEAPFAGIERMVIEDFRIYPWEAKNLSWDPVRTARLIGALTFMCRVKGLELVFQPAKIKEQAIAMGGNEHGISPVHENRHFIDAYFHGIYYLNTKEGIDQRTSRTQSSN
jgi:hypothetical protein